MSEKNDNRQSLLKSPIFKDLPADKIEEIARMAEKKVVPQDGIIFREGDHADGFYIVQSGKVRIFVRHDKGFERELAVLGPGENFGEVALLTGEKRTANVSAMEETSLLVLSREQFEHILDEYPEISRRFMKDMRSWLVRDQEIIEEEAEAVMQSSRMSWFDFLLIIGASVLLALTFNSSNPNGIALFPTFAEKPAIAEVSATEAMEMQKQGKALIIDAMPANFFQKSHIKGAVNMPMALFDIVYLMNFSDEDKGREILVYGNSISMPYDAEIAAKLQLRGHPDVKLIKGGLSAWEEKGYPVEGKSK